MVTVTHGDSNDIFPSSIPNREKQDIESATPTTQVADINVLIKPFNWPIRKKWTLTSTACYVTFIVGINATAITAVASETNVEFAVSDATFPNSVWPVTAWNTGAALAPMFVLPVMEEHGMRFAYLVTYILFFMFVIPQAVAKNFMTFIICRFLAGCCGGILQGIMDGIISDIWDGPVQRSLPVSCYVVSLLTGVSIGPVLGGAVAQRLDWRWILYLQLIIYGVSAPLVFLAIRETRLSAILSGKLTQQDGTSHSQSEPHSSKGHVLQTLKAFIRENIIRPSFLLCTEAVVFFFTLLSGLSYGLVFISTQSVAQVFSKTYGFTEPQTGFVQAALVVGEIAGFLSCHFIPDRHFKRALLASTIIPNPQIAEKRLYLAVPGSFIGLSGGMFWYGWTSSPTLSWWLPSAGLFLIGFGTMVVMQAIMMYVTDAYARYAASASAAICFGENIFAAFLPLASQGMYTRLGSAWASSILGFVAFVLSFAPVVLIWKGEEIRRKSPFMEMSVYN